MKVYLQIFFKFYNDGKFDSIKVQICCDVKDWEEIVKSV